MNHFLGDLRIPKQRLQHARNLACPGTIPATRTKKLGRSGKKGEIHRALDAGVGRVLIIAAIVHLDRLQVRSKWEMSAKG
jgi:hypothetical protein